MINIKHPSNEGLGVITLKNPARQLVIDSLFSLMDDGAKATSDWRKHKPACLLACIGLVQEGILARKHHLRFYQKHNSVILIHQNLILAGYLLFLALPLDFQKSPEDNLQ